MTVKALFVLMSASLSAAAADCELGVPAMKRGNYVNFLAFFNDLAVQGSACAYY